MSLLKDYHLEREALINADRALRLDHVRPNILLESEADQIVRCIRADDAESVWNVQQDEVPHPFPGTEFLTGKSIIQKTRLFRIISKYSMLREAEKRRLMKLWETRWEEFIEELVALNRS